MKPSKRRTYYYTTSSLNLQFCTYIEAGFYFSKFNSQLNPFRIPLQWMVILNILAQDLKLHLKAPKKFMEHAMVSTSWYPLCLYIQEGL